MSNARGGPEHNEIGSSPALKSEGLSSLSSSFLSISSIAFPPSVVVCFHRLTAFPAHSSAFSYDIL